MYYFYNQFKKTFNKENIDNSALGKENLFLEDFK